MEGLLRCKVTLVFDNGVTYPLNTKLPLEPKRAKEIRASIVKESILDGDFLPFLGTRPPELSRRVVRGVRNETPFQSHQVVHRQRRVGFHRLV